jgi:hypothetical protein
MVTETMNDANRARQATHDTNALGTFFPKNPFMRKPTAGNVGISQM